jgi:hypothetical protein
MLVDLKRPQGGLAPVASLYVQLSRARTRDQISILRDFDEAELRIPCRIELQEELEWEEEVAKTTAGRYAV